MGSAAGGRLGARLRARVGEQAVRDRALKTLSAGTDVLLKARDEADLIATMCATVVDTGGYRFAWYGRAGNDEEGTVSPVAAAGGAKAYLDGIRITVAEGPYGNGPTGVCLRTGAVHVQPDLQGASAMAPWHSRALASDMISAISLPIYCEGQLDGALTVYGRTRDEFDASAQSLLGRLAEQFGYGLGRLRDQARFRMLAENATDVIYQSDHDGRITWVSPSVTAVLGYEPAALLGTACHLLVHPDDQPTLGAALRGASSAGEMPPVRYLHADGAYRWMDPRVTVTPALGPGGGGAIVGLRDITAEHEAREELAYRAFHDQLTGLRNRASIVAILERAVERIRDDARTVAVLFIDLDNFKVVNDSLGHGAGDVVLARVAERLAAALGPTEHVGRFGGDEFVVVMPAVRDHLEVERTAEWIQAALAPDLTLGEQSIHSSVSIGIALAGPEATAQSLLRDADAALFEAKAGGRDRWHFFDDELRARALERMTLEAEIREGVRRGEFVAYYQPIVDLRDARVIGHEALVRWHHPVRGVVMPGDFIGVAEASGLISEIGRQVQDQVLAMLAETPLPGYVSVNVSPVQLRQSGWAAALMDAVEAFGVDPRRIAIEVTETAVLDVAVEVVEDLHRLRADGISILLDDFGTGFSSISVLRDLPVSGLKLDRSFVSEVRGVRDTSTVLVQAIGSLATSLELSSVAEGVETEAQRQVLLEHGWLVGQGYLFGRPAPEPRLGQVVGV
ncbi:MAG: putative bifunctional diguanylate cyclase/phosphodiesterase [Nocardioides sp.]